MKKYCVFALIACLLIFSSCNQKPHGADVTSIHTDTTVIKCIKLGIKVVDEKGNNCSAFQVKYSIDRGSTIFDWKTTPIDTNIHATSLWSIFRVKGNGVEVEKNLTSGINRDTTLIFVLQTCKK